MPAYARSHSILLFHVLMVFYAHKITSDFYTSNCKLYSQYILCIIKTTSKSLTHNYRVCSPKKYYYHLSLILMLSISLKMINGKKKLLNKIGISIVRMNEDVAIRATTLFYGITYILCLYGAWYTMRYLEKECEK